MTVVPEHFLCGQTSDIIVQGIQLGMLLTAYPGGSGSAEEAAVHVPSGDTGSYQFWAEQVGVKTTIGPWSDKGWATYERLHDSDSFVLTTAPFKISPVISCSGHVVSPYGHLVAKLFVIGPNAAPVEIGSGQSSSASLDTIGVAAITLTPTAQVSATTASHLAIDLYVVVERPGIAVGVSPEPLMPITVAMLSGDGRPPLVAGGAFLA